MMQLVRRNVKIRREQTGHLDQKSIGQYFFCKKKTYKKVTELINVSTFTACQAIKRAATIQGDEDMLHLLLGVNNDLLAAEAKYHKNC